MLIQRRTLFITLLYVAEMNVSLFFFFVDDVLQLKQAAVLFPRQIITKVSQDANLCPQYRSSIPYCTSIMNCLA